MNRRWLALAVGPGTDVVLPLENVDRLVHGTERAFESLSAAASDIGSVLGCEGRGRRAPGVLVVLSDGSAWTAEDLVPPDRLEGCRYLSVPADLVEGPRPWCRGLLAGPRGRFFIVEPGALAGEGSP